MNRHAGNLSWLVDVNGAREVCATKQMQTESRQSFVMQSCLLSVYILIEGTWGGAFELQTRAVMFEFGQLCTQHCNLQASKAHA
jgi:hypothetical protein